MSSLSSYDATPCVCGASLWYLSWRCINNLSVVTLTHPHSDRPEGEFEADPSTVEEQKRIKKQELMLTLEQHLVERPSKSEQAKQLSPRFNSDLDNSLRPAAFDLESKLQMVTLSWSFLLGKCWLVYLFKALKPCSVGGGVSVWTQSTWRGTMFRTSLETWTPPCSPPPSIWSRSLLADPWIQPSWSAGELPWRAS